MNAPARQPLASVPHLTSRGAPHPAPGSTRPLHGQAFLSHFPTSPLQAFPAPPKLTSRTQILTSRLLLGEHKLRQPPASCLSAKPQSLGIRKASRKPLFLTVPHPCSPIQVKVSLATPRWSFRNTGLLRSYGLRLTEPVPSPRTKMRSNTQGKWFSPFSGREN